MDIFLVGVLHERMDQLENVRIGAILGGVVEHRLTISQVQVVLARERGLL